MSPVNDPESYQSSRPDLHPYLYGARKLLDVGCNRGELCKALMERDSNLVCHGIDYNPEAVGIAQQALACVESIDLMREFDRIEQFLAANGPYDHIVAADVLEHLSNPLEVHRALFSALTPGGKILISLPNTGHWESLWHLLAQRWPRHNRGLYDRTHLTVFLRRNLSEFHPGSAGGMRIAGRKLKFLDTNTPSVFGKIMNRLILPLGLIPGLRNYFTFQFYIEVWKK
ncbi:methyltransferase domain-containing protein [bacterium]|nr:methyltransferase domain-containing protein [bacterium]